MSIERPKAIACCRVKDGGQYLTRWLDAALSVCEGVCILDDGSTDATMSILQDYARKTGRVFVHTQRGLEFNEGRDWNLLHDLAQNLKPDWFFAPDVDEIVEPEDLPFFRSLVDEAGDDILGWTFPFYYLWDSDEQYRIDGWYRNCHVIRLFRNVPGLRPPKRAVHSTMCPDELDRHRIVTANVRILHYGYLNAAERQRKYEVYRVRDPESDYSHIVSKEVVLEPKAPRLVWSCADAQERQPSLRRAPNKVLWGAPTRPGGYIHFRWPTGAVLERESWADEILCQGVLEHLTEEFVEPLLKSFFRVLKPGGFMEVSVPDFEARLRAACAAKDAAAYKASRGALYGSPDGRPIRSAWWSEEIQKMLSDIGFDNVQRVSVSELRIYGIKPGAD